MWSRAINQYSDYVTVDHAKVNGELTLAENIADGNGARLAYQAFQKRTQSHSIGTDPADGFTPEQRFFLAYGLRNCANITPELLKIIASENEHSLPKQRSMASFPTCRSSRRLIIASRTKRW